MDEVGAREDGEIGPVVDPERDTVGGRHETGLAERIEEPAVGERPVAHLDDVHAAADRRREELAEAGPDRRDEVEASYPPATGRATTSRSASSSSTSA